MKIYADMHMHTRLSDGSLEPEEVIELVYAKGLKGMAITDHEAFSEQFRLKKLAERKGLEYVTGMEMKTNLQPMLEKYGFQGVSVSELLVYGLKKDSLDELTQLVQKRNDMRLTYRKKVLEIMAQHDYSEIEGSKITGPILVTREEAARQKKNVFQVAKENAQVTHVAMKNFYLVQIQPEVAKAIDHPFYSLDIRDGIKKANKWGGLVVLAHPFTESRVDLKPFYEDAIKELVEAGLGGIECNYPEHTPELTSILKGYCDKYGLVATGGSDFHRPGDPQFELGSYGVYEAGWKKILEHVDKA